MYKITYSDPYTYEDDPRAYEYARYDKVINNGADMKYWLLNNDNEDPTIGIAPRYDLKEKSPSAFGLTDLKIVTPATLNNGFIFVYSGPSKSNGKFPPFNWNDWKSEASYGMPRIFDFDWEQYTIIEDRLTSSSINKSDLLEMWWTQLIIKCMKNQFIFVKISVFSSESIGYHTFLLSCPGTVFFG